VVLPVVVVLAVLGVTIAAMRGEADEADGALVVEVTGHQYWWEVRYPESGVVTANEVHIPAAVPVRLRLRSADVIHSFWVPELAGKRDLLPEHDTWLSLQADRPGRYGGSCAEFCGIQHALMAMTVVAHEPAAFAAWIERQRAAAGPVSGPAADGRAVFARSGCARCHTVRGAGAAGTGGPDLTHLASRDRIAAGTLAMTEADLRAWVEDPHDTKEGVAMPAAELTEAELDALVAYLRELE
jgi:cytochrome c oxidase subunit 2